MSPSRLLLPFYLLLSSWSSAGLPAQASPSCAPLQAQVLAASPGRLVGSFGQSVDIDGDAAVIGEPGFVFGALFGEQHILEAHVFRRAAGAWQETATINSPLPTLNSVFGHAVAISGDTIAIGDPGFGATTGNGAVFVFRFDGQQWNPEAVLLPAAGGTSQVMGSSLALEGNLLIAGAPGANMLGSAYVFRRNGTTWSREARLQSPNNTPGNSFGSDVAVQGSTVLIGTSRDDDPVVGANTGSVYVFNFDGTSWVAGAQLTPSDPVPEGLFGGAVAFDPTSSTALIAAPGATVAGIPSVGAAYVFQRNAGNWNELAKLAPNDPATNLFMGSDVDIRSGLAVVGAPSADPRPQGPARGGQGAAYVFRFDGSTWIQQAKIIDPNASSLNGDNLGFSVALDDESSPLIGVPGDETAAGDAAGTARVFDPQISSEVVRAGVPPNPNAFRPGRTSGPVIGSTWDPVVDHTTFVPGANLDFIVISTATANIALGSAGTLLCDLSSAPSAVLAGAVGQPFAIPMPPDCSLVGLTLCSQGGSVAGIALQLANALDITIGAF